MPRPIEQPFHCEPLSDLARQLLYAPAEKRLEQVRRAEQLHDEIDPARVYPFDFVNFRITGFHAEQEAQTLLVGEAVLPDLRLLIDLVSKSAPLPVAAGESLESAEDLAIRLNVSTKTIARWRKLGLRWRWVVSPPPGAVTGAGRKWLAYPREAVDRFLAANPDRVERASHFTQLEPETRQRILDRARRIAQSRDVSLNQVAVHLAKKYDRALETIRQLLMQHDAQNPEDRIFADYTGPLSARQKRVIARAYRMGVSVGRLSRHFKRTRSTIYRTMHERRAAELAKVKIHYQTWPTFERNDADQVILRPEPAEKSPAAPPAEARVDDLPEPLRPLYRQARLDPARERSLIVRLNYLKYKAVHLRDALDKQQPRAADLDLIEDWLRQARTLRDRLVAANLAVVLAVARKHLTSDSLASTTRLVELLELGNVVLIETLDRYDGARGQNFEAFLTWSLMREFAIDDLERSRQHKAHPRLDGSAVLKRMQDTAGESGVALKVDPG